MSDLEAKPNTDKAEKPAEKHASKSLETADKFGELMSDSPVFRSAFKKDYELISAEEKTLLKLTTNSKDDG